MDSIYANLSLSKLDVDEQEAAPTTLGAFAAGKPLVLDFWHTRCVRCPAALSKLDGEVAKHPEFQFASCAFSLGSETEGTQEQVLELLEGQWENLAHTYMTFDEKEATKKVFGITAVPFVVVFGADGALKFKGEPKDLDLNTVLNAAPVDQLAADLAEKVAVSPAAAGSPTGIETMALEKPVMAEKKPLAEANALPPPPTAVLGFGNDDDDDF